MTFPNDVIERLEAARRFPMNTDGASRHLELMAEALSSSQRYAMLEEDAPYCADSIRSVVASLYEARNQNAEAASLIKTLREASDSFHRRMVAAEAQVNELTQAVETEREECAQVAEAQSGVQLAADIARAIRARSTQDKT